MNRATSPSFSSRPPMTGLVQIDALVDQADPFSLSLDELNRLIAEINEIGACALADWCSGIRDHRVYLSFHH